MISMIDAASDAAYFAAMLPLLRFRITLLFLRCCRHATMPPLSP